MINTIKNYSDPETLPIGAATVMAGSAAAAYMGNFEPFTATLCLLYVIFMQMFGNLLYRYSLVRRDWGDGVERYIAAQASRGSTHRLGDILKAGMTITGILAGMVGLTLLSMAQTTTWVLILALLITVYIYFNTFGPRPLVRTPASLFTTFIMFGPVGVLATTYIQATYKAIDPISWQDMGPSLACSIIVGLYAIEPQLSYNIHSYEFDKYHGKTTLVTLIGQRNSLFVLWIIGIATACVATISALKYPHIHTWVPIVIFWAAAIANIIVTRKIYNDRSNPDVFSWPALNWLCLIAMTLYFVYSFIWGHPDYRNIEIF